jgi:hypothetical protein
MFGLLLLLPLALLAQESSELVGQLGGRTALLVLHSAQRPDGPGGQERERFAFSEEFPPMDRYSATVQCQADEASTSFQWRSPSCTLSRLQQQPLKGGLRLASGPCAVTLREVGDEVKVDAERCARQCAASPQPLLVDRRGGCRVLRPKAR